jgi:hypothetical protein
VRKEDTRYVWVCDCVDEKVTVGDGADGETYVPCSYESHDKLPTCEVCGKHTCASHTCVVRFGMHAYGNGVSVVDIPNVITVTSCPDCYDHLASQLGALMASYVTKGVKDIASSIRVSKVENG